MANDINLRIQLNADGSFSVINTGAASLENLGRNANTANRNLEQLENGTHKVSSALRSMAALAATALGGFSMAKAVQEIGSFESKMNSVRALTMANAAEMAALSKQARDLGATTAFSAQQSADAQGVLASAGLKTNEILKATPGILNLAAAGALELSKAAEVATGVLSGMSLSLDDLPHINDVLVKVAADTKSSVGSIGEALAVSAPIAKTFGISLEELSASMGVLANNNIKGSEAGNNFKSMLAALGNETKQNTAILAEHGLTYKDLDVQTRGLVPVLETLRNAHLSGAEAINIFGTDAAAAGLALAGSASDVDKLSKALKDSKGAADVMAAILNQGLEKEIDALYGAVSEAVLQLGEGGLKGALSEIITTTTGVISVYEGLLPRFAESNKLSVEQTANLKNLAATFADTAKAALGLAGGILAVVSAFKGYEIAVAAVAAVSSINPFVGLMVALGALIGMIATAKSGLLSLNNAKSKLSDIDAKITHQENKLIVMKNQGFIGRTIDTLVGNSETGTLDEITKLHVRRNAIVKSLNAEKAATDAAAVSTANKAAQDASAAGKAAALAAATHTSGAAHHAAAGGVAKHAAAHKGLSDAHKSTNQVMEDAKRLTESLMTPQEKFNSEMGKAVRLYNAGKIGLETLDRALLKYSDDLANNNESKFVAVTAQEKLNEAYQKAWDLIDGKGGKSVSPEGGAQLLSDAAAAFSKDTTQDVSKVTKSLEYYDNILSSINSKTAELGATNNAVFDSALKGASQLSGIFSNLGNTLQDVAQKMLSVEQNHQSAIAEIDKIQDNSSWAKARIAEEEKYHKTTQALQNKAISAEVSGIRQAAAAAKSMFSEKSAARKAFSVIETTLSALEAAQAIQNSLKVVSASLAEGTAKAGVAVANQGSGDPYTAFARIAAMIALMASIGYQVGGAGQSAYANLAADRQAAAGTGTVLGDDKAKSESINKSIEQLKDNSDLTLPISQSMLTALLDIKNNIGNLGIVLAKQFGVKSPAFTADKLGYSSILPEIMGSGQMMSALVGIPFGVKKELADFGLTFEPKDGQKPQRLQNILDGDSLNLQIYNDIERKNQIFGMTISSSLNRYREEASQELKDQFGLVFKNAANLGIDMAKQFNISPDQVDNVIKNFKLNIPDISLKDLSGDKITEALNNVMSAATDDFAKQLLKGAGLEPFQRIGEGFLQTSVRVANGIELADSKLMKFGVDIVKYGDIVSKQGDVGLEIYKQTALNMESSSSGVISGVGKIIKNFDGSVADLDTIYVKLRGIRSTLNATGINGNHLSAYTIQGAGGLDDLNKSVNLIATEGVSKTKQFNDQFAELGQQFTSYGQVMPTSIQQYKSLVASIDTSTDSGQRLQGQLLSLAPAVYDLNDLFKGSQAEIQALMQIGYSAEDSSRMLTHLTDSFGDLGEGMRYVNNIVNAFFNDIQKRTFQKDYYKGQQQAAIDSSPYLQSLGVKPGMSVADVQHILDANKITWSDIGKYNLNVNAATDPVSQFLNATSNYAFVDKSTAQDNYAAQASTNKSSNTTIDDAAKKSEDNAKAITDFMRPFKDAQATRGLSDYAKSLRQLQLSYADNITKANELKVSTQDLALITANYNDDVKAAAQNVLSPLMDEFNAIGKTDLEKNLNAISKWQAELIADAPDIAKAMNIQLEVFKQGVQKIADNRTLTALKETFNVLENFKTSISDWVLTQNLKTGTPVDQFQVAQANALDIYTQAMAGNQAAMGKVTSAADTYLTAIDAAYGSSDVGASLKRSVIDAVDQLPDQINLADIIKSGNDKNAEELRLLREEVKKLREENQQQTEAIIETNYDANGKAAKSIVGGVADSTDKQIHASNAKPELA